LGLSEKTVSRYADSYALHGLSKLFTTTKNVTRKADDPRYVDAVTAVLHSPPHDYGVNRTTWKQDDLHRVLAAQGFGIARQNIRAILKKQGYRWRKARKVLTSRDPEYREKVARITAILANIGSRERFFSIDEFGPFSITIRGGQKLVAPGEEYTVPQWQKSKGSLIVTAALELCMNQVTHFYSRRKNTDEMLRLLDVLLKQYADMETLYLSWDAASWHLSDRFKARVAEINLMRESRPEIPRIELAPLPSGAQFLNVIESVFSGMARAIIHNSDYQSDEEARQAIDRNFADRNKAFTRNPRRAGKKIWGQERVASQFSESNNCKDAKWR
jgi:transposase